MKVINCIEIYKRKEKRFFVTQLIKLQNKIIYKD